MKINNYCEVGWPFMGPRVNFNLGPIYISVHSLANLMQGYEHASPEQHKLL